MMYLKKLLKLLTRITICLLSIIVMLFVGLQFFQQKTYLFFKKIDYLIGINVKNGFENKLYKFEKQKEIITSYLLNYENDIIESPISQFNIMLSDSAIKQLQLFDTYPFKNKFLTNYFNCKFINDTTVNNAKFKYHIGYYQPELISTGCTPHHSYFKKSFKLKFGKQDSFKGSRKWSFIIPEDRYYLGTMISNVIAEKLKMPAPQNGISIINVNSKFYGIYYYEEDIDYNKKFLVRNGFTNSVIFKLQLKNDLGSYIQNSSTIGLWQPVALNYLTELPDKKKNVLKRKFSILYDIINNNIQDSLLSYFDTSNLSSLAALLAIRQYEGIHDIVDGNIRIIYSFEKNKFFIASRCETTLSPIEGLNNIERDIVYSYPKGIQNKFLYYILSNDIIRKGMILNLSNLIYNNNIVEDYENLIGLYGNFLCKDVSQSFLLREILQNIINTKEVLITNINSIKDLYNFKARCFINIIKKNTDLYIDIIPDSYSPLCFKIFNLKVDSAISQQKNKLNIEVFEDEKLICKKLVDVKKNYINLEEALVDQNIYLFNKLNEDLYPVQRKIIIKLKDFSLNSSLNENGIFIEVENLFRKSALTENELFLTFIE